LRNLQCRLAGKHAEATATEVHRHRSASCGYRQCTVTCEINFLPCFLSTVVFNIEIGNRKLEIIRFKPVHAHIVGMCLECAVRRSCRILDAQIPEVKAVNAETVQIGGLPGKGLAAVDTAIRITHKRSDIRTAYAETFGSRHRCSGSCLEGIAVINLFKADRTTEIEEARNRKCRTFRVDTQLLAAKINCGTCGCTEFQSTVE